MKFKLFTMIIFMVSACQAQIQVGTSEDDLISWRVAFISADSMLGVYTVPDDVKIVTREDTVTLSWVQPLAREEFPPTILDSVGVYYSLDIYTNEVLYLPANDTSVAVEYSKTILLVPNDYWIAIRNCSISGKVSPYSYDPFPIRVKGKPGDPIMMPVSIDLIIKQGAK